MSKKEMIKLSIFESKEFLGQEINVYGDIETPYFLAADVAKWIEYKQPTRMIERSKIDNHDMIKAISDVTTSHTQSEKKTKKRNTQEMLFLTENGVYEVLLTSIKPKAKEYRKFVKAVLKELRKNGSYTVTEEDDSYLLSSRDKSKESNKKRNRAISYYKKIIEKKAPNDYVRFSQQINRLLNVEPKSRDRQPDYVNAMIAKCEELQYDYINHGVNANLSMDSILTKCEMMLIPLGEVLEGKRKQFKSEKIIIEIRDGRFVIESRKIKVS